MVLSDIRAAARQAMEQLLEAAHPEKGALVVVGCSSSEILGEKIGTASAPEVGQAVVEGVLPPLRERGLYLAAQCCEHLNRALIIEAAALACHGLVRVNVRPQPKAGGSFATAAWAAFEAPAVVEEIQAAAGMDIGNTLIGMHLRPVAVPVRLAPGALGAAPLVAARTRPKFIGGVRAVYDEPLL